MIGACALSDFGPRAGRICFGSLFLSPWRMIGSFLAVGIGRLDVVLRLCLLCCLAQVHDRVRGYFARGRASRYALGLAEFDRGVDFGLHKKLCFFVFV